MLDELTGAFAFVSRGVAGIGSWIWDGLISGWDATVNWFSTNSSAIWDGLVSGWDFTKAALSDGWQTVKGYASDFGDWIASNGTTIWTGLISGWDFTKVALSDGWSAITGYASDFANWLSTNGPVIWDGLKTGWETTKTILSSNWNEIKGYVSDFGNWIAANGAALWDGVVNGWNKASKLLSDGWSALEGVVTKFGEWLSGIGTTLWNGITSGWNAAKGVLEEGLNWVGSAWDKTASVAGDMWNSLKSFVGFESTGDEIIDQKALAQQLNDITVLDKMSKTFADRVAAMSNEWQPFKQSLAEGFENIFSVMTELVTKITGEFVPAIQAASQEFRNMQSAVSAVATAANGGTAPSSRAPAPGSSYLWGGAKAKGGILTGPQIVLAGEAGPEAIIPLTNESYGLPLLQQAASAFGLQVTAPEYSLSELSSNLASVSNITNTSMSTNTSTSTNTSNMTNAPIINIMVEGGADSDANSLAAKIRDAVANVLRSLQEDEMRGAYV